MRLVGFQAIGSAELAGFPLNKSADPVDEPRSGLTVTEGKAIGGDDPGVIWLEIAVEKNLDEQRNMEPER